MNKLLSALAVAALLTAPAVAAAGDTAQGAAPSWGGWKLGVNLSSTRHDARWTDLKYDWYGGSLTNSYQGTTYGLAAGWDHQSGRTLLGVELSGDFSSMERLTRYANDVHKTDGLVALYQLRGRAGLAFDKALLFASAGVARANVRHTWIEDNDVSDTWWGFGNAKFGWTAGLGVEYAHSDRVALRVEFVRSHIPGDKHDNDDTYTMEVDETFEALRVGAVYRF